MAKCLQCGKPCGKSPIFLYLREQRGRVVEVYICGVRCLRKYNEGEVDGLPDHHGR